MGTRISLGKGFTLGRSGVRWGHSIPGISRSYVSVGRSGTLLAGFHLRHWEPNRRGAALPVAPRRSERGAWIAALLMVVLILGFFAVLTRVDADYARTHDSQGQPIAPPRKTPIDCATDPIAPYVYACTDHPAIMAPYQER